MMWTTARTWRAWASLAWLYRECLTSATDDTPLEGSKLVVKILPVTMHCDKCAQDVELPGLQSFRCPRCDEPLSDLRQGRELEIESIEIDEVEETV